VIAKLDRLAWSVALISGLMESGVEFVAADMPDANRFMLHIMAAVAEHKREMISQRTLHQPPEELLPRCHPLRPHRQQLPQLRPTRRHQAMDQLCPRRLSCPVLL